MRQEHSLQMLMSSSISKTTLSLGLKLSGRNGPCLGIISSYGLQSLVNSEQEIDSLSFPMNLFAPFAAKMMNPMPIFFSAVTGLLHYGVEQSNGFG
jgi:hypothetical protein